MVPKARELARWMTLAGFGLAGVLSCAAPASAGLIGAGRTVQVTYYNGSTSAAENESTSSGPGPVSIASAGVTFLAGTNSGSTVQISDNQITIVNTASNTPYCSGNFASTGCTDQISGFDVLFTGESITGVSVNAALTDPSMEPVFGTAPPYQYPHNGLQLLSANEILVDLTGDLPAGTQTLTLNVTTAAGSVGTPEPRSVALLGVGLLGLLAVRRRALPASGPAGRLG